MLSPIHDQGHGGQGLALFALDSPARSLAQNRCSKNKGGREAGREGGRERGRQGAREAGREGGREGGRQAQRG